MRVVIEVRRAYEMDEARILAEADFDPPPPDASNAEKRHWLRESFHELCGASRDQDHIDGSYVKLADEDTYEDFYWPDDLHGA